MKVKTISLASWILAVDPCHEPLLWMLVFKWSCPLLENYHSAQVWEGGKALASQLPPCVRGLSQEAFPLGPTVLLGLSCQLWILVGWVPLSWEKAPVRALPLDSHESMGAPSNKSLLRLIASKEDVNPISELEAPRQGHLQASRIQQLACYQRSCPFHQSFNFTQRLSPRLS